MLKKKQNLFDLAKEANIKDIPFTSFFSCFERDLSSIKLLKFCKKANMRVKTEPLKELFENHVKENKALNLSVLMSLVCVDGQR